MVYVGVSNPELSAEEKNDPANQHWTYRTERWRYIRYYKGAEELYDHEADPHEWVNVAGSPEYEPVRDRLYEEMMLLINPPAAGIRE